MFPCYYLAFNILEVQKLRALKKLAQLLIWFIFTNVFLLRKRDFPLLKTQQPDIVVKKENDFPFSLASKSRCKDFFPTFSLEKTSVKTHVAKNDLIR